MAQKNDLKKLYRTAKNMVLYFLQVKFTMG